MPVLETEACGRVASSTRSLYSGIMGNFVPAETEVNGTMLAGGELQLDLIGVGKLFA